MDCLWDTHYLAVRFHGSPMDHAWVWIAVPWVDHGSPKGDARDSTGSICVTHGPALWVIHGSNSMIRGLLHTSPWIAHSLPTGLLLAEPWVLHGCLTSDRQIPVLVHG